MRVVIASVALVAVCAAGIVLAQSDKPKNTGPDKSPELRQLGKHLAKGQADRNAGSYGGSDPLLFHAGGTVTSFVTEVHPIYWGTKWADSAFVGDKISGLALFYAGASSPYLSTNTEYTGSTGLHTSDPIVEPNPDTPYIDSTHAAPTGDVQPITVLNEVCNFVGSGVKRHAYYPVYVDSPRGNVGYCAYHSSGTCANGTPVDFAFFFNLDGDRGCDPVDTRDGPFSRPLGAGERLGARVVGAPVGPVRQRLVRQDGLRELRQVRVDVRPQRPDVLEQHDLEGAGQLVERRVHREPRLRLRDHEVHRLHRRHERVLIPCSPRGAPAPRGISSRRTPLRRPSRRAILELGIIVGESKRRALAASDAPGVPSGRDLHP